jgi:threonine dehydrogenase-like Zn-dependent dehydrogenase
MNCPGVFAEYFITRPDSVRKIPPGMSFATASLMEPVCVCMEAVNRGKVKEGDRVLIAGDGPFGIMISKLCAHKNPKQIIQTGTFDYRLKQVAGPLTTTLNINDEPNLVKKVMELTDGEGIDTAILCVASPEAVDLCIEVLRARGIFVVFSATVGKTPVDLHSVHLKELNFAGSNNDENYMDEAIRLLGDPDLDFKGIITHEVPFSEWEKAFDIADNQKDSCLKVSMLMP